MLDAKYCIVVNGYIQTGMYMYNIIFVFVCLFVFLFCVLQRDPLDKDVPYCTLKSFPATIEHTIQWARDKVSKEKLCKCRPSFLPSRSLLGTKHT